MKREPASCWRRALGRVAGFVRYAGRFAQGAPAAESGQAIVWVAVMLPFLLAVAGLSIDGGAAFNARLRLQQVAGAAARAGATQIDERAYRESNGASVVLDGARARRVASDYLTQSGVALTGTVQAEPRRVVVEVSQDVPTSFLRVVGLTSVRISATAPAELRYGVGQGAK